MNYLIVTFDGFGDGVIYYPVFREIGSKMQKSEFFYTSNLLFSDSDIRNKIDLPSNLKVVSEEIRKFHREDWGIIYDFLKKNCVKVVINLRFIGRKFEKDYFEFKQWISLKNLGIVFFDDENLQNKEKINVNARNIIRSITEKALNMKLYYTINILDRGSSQNKRSDDILINVHSRGVAKLWNIKKWAELISSLVLSNKNVKVYEGFGDVEELYIKEVIDGLQPNIKNRIEIVRYLKLGDLVRYLPNVFLLISVDSGLIHLADSFEINSLGIYLTTSPKVWGGVTNKFHYVESKHISSCKNFYPYFGMCMNNKKKCKNISNGKDDILVADVSRKTDQIFYAQKN